MHLTLRQLQCFAAVARNRSFTRAADELHLTQPAVSMQVRQLEQQTGVTVTERPSPPPIPAVAGTSFIAHTGHRPGDVLGGVHIIGQMYDVAPPAAAVLAA